MRAQTCARDLDLEPVTLKLDPRRDILKAFHHTENEVARSRHLKVVA